MTNENKSRTRQDVEAWLDAGGFLDEELILADGFDSAFIGVCLNHEGDYAAVYSIDRCLQLLVERDGMSDDEADEYFDFNVLGAHVGPKTPMFLHLMPDGLMPGLGMPDDKPSAPTETAD